MVKKLKKIKFINLIECLFKLIFKKELSKAAYEKEIVELLDSKEIELVCLAGYMRLVGETLLNAYEGRIININENFENELPRVMKKLNASKVLTISLTL